MATKKKATKKKATKKKATKNLPVTVVFSDPTTGQGYQAGMPFVIERILAPWEVDIEYQARKEELDKVIEKAQRVLDRWWKKLKKTADYQKHLLKGASVRFRTKFGQVVSPLRVVIAINVAMKLGEDQLKRRKSLSCRK